MLSENTFFKVISLLVGFLSRPSGRRSHRDLERLFDLDSYNLPQNLNCPSHIVLIMFELKTATTIPSTINIPADFDILSFYYSPMTHYPATSDGCWVFYWLIEICSHLNVAIFKNAFIIRNLLLVYERMFCCCVLHSNTLAVVDGWQKKSFIIGHFCDQNVKLKIRMIGGDFNKVMY